MLKVITKLIIFLGLLPNLAYAYAGPGMALSGIIAVIGVLAGVFLLLVGFIWYPLKRLFLHFRQSKMSEANSEKEN
jgi:hypothetical protein